MYARAIVGGFDQAGEAYTRLREMIVEGVIAPGEPLREQGLAKDLGMSRTPIREAFRRLESDGLVRSTGRGVVVAALDPAGVRAAYQVRTALEGLVAELAARRQAAGRIAAADLEDLESYAADTERATVAGDLDAAVAHNRRFHRQVAQLSANRLAMELLDRTWDQITVSTRSYLATTDSGEDLAADHRALIEAIKAGDPERASAAVRDHVARTLA